MPSLQSTCFGRPAARVLSGAAVLLVLLSLLGAVVPTFATTSIGSGEPKQDRAKEYEVKALALMHFAKYTTWPKESFKKDDSPIVIWVVGKDPFGKTLDARLKGKKLGDRAYVIRRISTVKAALADKKRPHMLFVGTLSARDTKKLLDGFIKQPVVVIGDKTGMAVKGALISFILEEGHVRFQVNPTAAKKRQIQFSSQFLKLAKIVPRPK